MAQADPSLKVPGVPMVHTALLPTIPLPTQVPPFWENHANSMVDAASNKQPIYSIPPSRRTNSQVPVPLPQDDSNLLQNILMDRPKSLPAAGASEVLLEDFRRSTHGEKPEDSKFFNVPPPLHECGKQEDASIKSQFSASILSPSFQVLQPGFAAGLGSNLASGKNNQNNPNIPVAPHATLPNMAPLANTHTQHP